MAKRTLVVSPRKQPPIWKLGAYSLILSVANVFLIAVGIVVILSFEKTLPTALKTALVLMVYAIGLLCIPLINFFLGRGQIFSPARSFICGLFYGTGFLSLYGLAFLAKFPSNHAKLWVWVSLPIGFLLFGVLGIVVWYVLKWMGFDVLIQDGTLCPHCGYSLIGNTTMRCPECGHPFTPQELGNA